MHFMLARGHGLFLALQLKMRRLAEAGAAMVVGWRVTFRWSG